MSNQVYVGIPGNNMYNQNIKLIQYNPTVNPLDPLGLQGMQYTVANPSNYLNKNINSQNPNQAYSKQAQAQINQYKLQNMYANNNVNPTQLQHIIQPQKQPQQNQKFSLKYNKSINTIINNLKPSQKQWLIKSQITSNNSKKFKIKKFKPNLKDQNLMIWAIKNMLKDTLLPIKIKK